MKTNRKSRRVDEKRTMNTMIFDAKRRLHKKLLTLAEYNEIYSDFLDIWEFREVFTISQKVADFFRLFGIHVVESGIGWKMLWY